MKPDIIERAFQLADDGKHFTVGEIREALLKERYECVSQHLSGKAFGDQLRARIAAARGLTPRPRPKLTLR